MGAGPVMSEQRHPLDLRRFSNMSAYSLQIAVFDAGAGGDFRDQAELYAKSLREKGEEAYFYHGPHRSMVTVGVFSANDFEQGGTYGARIRAVQERFPYHTVNGEQISEQANGEGDGNKRPHKSFVVHVI